MIEITCTPTGDIAYADDPHAALVAARQLMEDARSANPYQGYRPTCNFRANGKPIPGMHRVGEQAVWTALGKLRSQA